MNKKQNEINLTLGPEGPTGPTSPYSPGSPWNYNTVIIRLVALVFCHVKCMNERTTVGRWRQYWMDGWDEMGWGGMDGIYKRRSIKVEKAQYKENLNEFFQHPVFKANTSSKNKLTVEAKIL